MQQATEPEDDILFIYVDESSTLGFNGEDYFSIASIIVDHISKKGLKNRVRKYKKKFFLDPTKELKASSMNTHEKQVALNCFLKTNFTVNYLVADKRNISKDLFKKKSVCFNYFIYLMLRNILNSTDKKHIYICIDNRNVKVTSEKSLEDYLNIKMVESSIYDKDIHVTYCDSKKHLNIQVADLISNVVFAKYNYNKDHLFSLLKTRIGHAELFPRKFFTN